MIKRDFLKSSFLFVEISKFIFSFFIYFDFFIFIFIFPSSISKLFKALIYPLKLKKKKALGQSP